MRPVREQIQLTGLENLAKIASVAQDWMRQTAVEINNVIDGFRFQAATRAVTAATTLDFADGIVEVNATGGAVTITLPLLDNAGKVPSGKLYKVMKTDSSANVVTVSANTGQTINGAASVALTAQYMNAQISVPASGLNFLRWV